EPDPRRPLLPWLATVARNFALIARRGESRRRAREARSALPEALPSTASIVERESTRRRVVDAVLALEEPLRSTVVLRYLDGLPPRALARRMTAPVETVRSRQKRALALLRAKLAPTDSEAGDRFGASLLALAQGAPSVTATTVAGGHAPALGALFMTTQAKIA